MRILADADSSGSVVNDKDDEGWSPIHSATSSGNLDIVKILVDRGKIISSNLKLLVL